MQIVVAKCSAVISARVLVAVKVMKNSLKQTTKITVSAMMAALATAFMLLSYFPYLFYAIPAIAGLFIMVVLIEVDFRWALMSYIVSAILVFMFAEPESRFLYVFFFGYYPIVKALLEKLNKPVIEWVVKVIVFNAAVLSVYLIFAKFFDFSIDDFGELGKYGAFILLFLGNVVFVLYDITISRTAMVYMKILHPKIKKLLR